MKVWLIPFEVISLHISLIKHRLVNRFSSFSINLGTLESFCSVRILLDPCKDYDLNVGITNCRVHPNNRIIFRTSGTPKMSYFSASLPF